MISGFYKAWVVKVRAVSWNKLFWVIVKLDICLVVGSIEVTSMIILEPFALWLHKFRTHSRVLACERLMMRLINWFSHSVFPSWFITWSNDHASIRLSFKRSFSFTLFPIHQCPIWFKIASIFKSICQVHICNFKMLNSRSKLSILSMQFWELLCYILSIELLWVWLVHNSLPPIKGTNTDIVLGLVHQSFKSFNFISKLHVLTLKTYNLLFKRISLMLNLVCSLSQILVWKE